MQHCINARYHVTHSMALILQQMMMILFNLWWLQFYAMICIPILYMRVVLSQLQGKAMPIQERHVLVVRHNMEDYALNGVQSLSIRRKDVGSRCSLFHCRAKWLPKECPHWQRIPWWHLHWSLSQSYHPLHQESTRCRVAGLGRAIAIWLLEWTVATKVKQPEVHNGDDWDRIIWTFSCWFCWGAIKLMRVGGESDFNNGGPTKKMTVDEEQEESKDVAMQEGGRWVCSHTHGNDSQNQ